MSDQWWVFPQVLSEKHRELDSQKHALATSNSQLSQARENLQKTKETEVCNLFLIRQEK